MSHRPYDYRVETATNAKRDWTCLAS